MPDDLAGGSLDGRDPAQKSGEGSLAPQPLWGLSPATISSVAPWWPAQGALAHTLAYDATIMGDYSLPTERVASVTVPTLLIDGGASFPWLSKTAQAIADIIPEAQRRTLEGQTHNVASGAIAPALDAFFGGRSKPRGSVSGEDC